MILSGWWSLEVVYPSHAFFLWVDSFFLWWPPFYLYPLFQRWVRIMATFLLRCMVFTRQRKAVQVDVLSFLQLCLVDYLCPIVVLILAGTCWSWLSREARVWAKWIKASAYTLSRGLSHSTNGMVYPWTSSEKPKERIGVSLNPRNWNP